MMSIITFRFAEYYPTQPQYKAIRHAGLAILRSNCPEIMHMLINLLGLGDVHVCLWTWSPLMMTSSNLMETFSRYRPFVRGNHPPPVDSPHKGPWRGALMFSLICAWTNSWANNRGAGDLKRHRAHYNVTVIGWAPCHHLNQWWRIVHWIIKNKFRSSFNLNAFFIQ